MIVNLTWPTTRLFGGGLAVLFEFANGLAARGHEVHFLHVPSLHERVRAVSEISWFEFHEDVQHHFVDSYDDPKLPVADVCLWAASDSHLGRPAAVIQGYGLMPPKFERPAFRGPGPKLCVATWLREVGIAWGVPPEQMLHQPIGIDHDLFQPRRPLTDRPIDVAMLCSTHPVKGTDDGLEALSELRRRRPELRVELFGLVRPEVEPPGWARYNHGLDRSDLVEQIYDRTKVFLQPSWREGFGLTAVEAMACGAALVTTDNGGSRDYAIHDETALVVMPRRPTEMADSVEALLSDESRRCRLALAGERYVRRFTWDRAIDALESHLLAYLADPDRFEAPPADAPAVPAGTW